MKKKNCLCEKGKLTPLFVFNGQLMNKRQFNYRKKKFLNSLSEEERKDFENQQRAYTCIWRSFYEI